MGFGSDVIEVRVSPYGDTLFVWDGEGSRIVNEIYIGDYWDISAQLELYRRFSEYISVTRIISAIIPIYRLSGKKRQLSQTFF
ncbi:hypothetical protein ABE42_27375 [Bacillus thuringiensis]|uniref:Uncharacterized protein n=1 Tax=Bacillus thuringiensis TaxID=1428 RepID=A0A437SLE2_BACTU|nr:hypothetical protein [Bacillus thuringiensis]MBG9582838.1 hypothetical protein [Bacillus thuringiensis]RVU64052.1 hypothetical protein BM74_12305 [Bacillus thuringiensis]